MENSVTGQRLKMRNRQRSLGLSEIMTILIAVHQSHYRTFKSYSPHQVRQYWSDAFPKLVSYSRFVTWISCCMMPLCCYLKTCFRADTGISFVDATSLKAYTPRIDSHQDSGIAARGKTSVD